MFQQRPEGEGDIYDPVVSLNDMVTKAIEILSQNPNGFLLFVEEEATDEFSHQNNATYVLKGVQELDIAVKTALDFATEDGRDAASGHGRSRMRRLDHRRRGG